MLLVVLRKIYSFLIDIAQTLLLAGVFFLVVYFFLIKPFQVNGQSMYPNFKDKEYVLTSVVSLMFTSPKLGDVIVFKAPPDTEKDFIKRVIGTPGDKIMVKNGSVYLNGNLLDESKYLKSDVKTYGGNFLKEGQEITVPSDQYLAFGDNRSNSSDSREWGFVPKDYIIGYSFFIYWPTSDMQTVTNPY